MGCGASAKVSHDDKNQLLAPKQDSTRSSLEPRDDFKHNEDIEELMKKPVNQIYYISELCNDTIHTPAHLSIYLVTFVLQLSLTI